MCRVKALQISILTIIFLLFTGIATVYAQGNSSEELRQTINDKYDQFTQYIKDNKPGEPAEALYTKEAKFYTPNGGMVEGTEGVTKL